MRKTLIFIAIAAIAVCMSNVALAGLVIDIRAVEAGANIGNTDWVSNTSETVTYNDEKDVEINNVDEVVTFAVYLTFSNVNAGNVTSYRYYYAVGLIKEIDVNGVHGDMSWNGTDPDEGDAPFIYQTYKSGLPPTADWENDDGDIDMSDPDGNFGSVTTVEATLTKAAGQAGVLIGTFDWTATAGITVDETTTISYDPLQTSGGAKWRERIGTTWQTVYYSPLTASYAAGDDVIITNNIIPEPSTLVLLGMGCLALLAYRRRK